MKLGPRESLPQKYIKIFIVVSCYWVCSIGMVFLNKYLLSSTSLQFNAPLFVTWYQCIWAVFLCFVCAYVAESCPALAPFAAHSFDYRISREVLSLSIVFVGMITTNNLCLKYVGVSFYYVGRSLTTVFNVVCSYIILGQATSVKALICCALIIFGFLLGVDQEEESGTLSMIGVFYGVTASLCVALNAIFTQRKLPVVGDNIAELIMYNNLNAVVLFLPLLLLFEFNEVLHSPQLFSLHFWLLMSISGIFGFLMSCVTAWQIQVTSSLTHNISGTAKAAAQTVLAVAWFNEIKSIFWWISNFIVLGGSGAYTLVRRKEMAHKYESDLSKDHDSSEELIPKSAEKIVSI